MYLKVNKDTCTDTRADAGRLLYLFCPSGTRTGSVHLCTTLPSAGQNQHPPIKCARVCTFSCQTERDKTLWSVHVLLPYALMPSSTLSRGSMSTQLLMLNGRDQLICTRNLQPGPTRAAIHPCFLFYQVVNPVVQKPQLDHGPRSGLPTPGQNQCYIKKIFLFHSNRCRFGDINEASPFHLDLQQGPGVLVSLRALEDPK